MNFTFTQLRYFTETVRSGSMTQAARKLQVSQPTLSTAIAHLERDLGVTLLERKARSGIRLTSAGRQFHADAVALLARAENMSERAETYSASLSGTLRVGMYGPLTAFRAPGLVNAMARRHPQISLEIVEGDHEGLLRLLDEHSIDVALAYAMAPLDGYASEVLTTIAPHVLVPAQHPLAGAREPVSLARFATDPLILLDMPHTASYYLGLFRAVGVEPTVRFRLQGYETVRGLVGHGFGITVLNQRIAHSMTYGGMSVAEVEIAERLEGLTLCLIRRAGEESRRVEELAEACRQLYAHPAPNA